jgi:hypothetical protein
METEVLGEDLPQCCSFQQDPTWLDPGSNTGREGKKLAISRLRYDTATMRLTTTYV